MEKEQLEKEEFPTFLNEKPSVAFGRTSRELIVFLIGIALTYVVWVNVGRAIPAQGVGVTLLQALLAAIPLVGSIVVAFVNVGARPLEEWALVGIFFWLTPKVFIYTPCVENEADETEIDLYQYQLGKQQNVEEYEI